MRQREIDASKSSGTDRSPTDKEASIDGSGDVIEGEGLVVEGEGPICDRSRVITDRSGDVIEGEGLVGGG